MRMVTLLSTYTVNVEAADEEGNTAKQQTRVTVQALSTDIWNITANEGTNGAAVKYDIEMSATAIDEADGDKAIATASLRALSGSKFAGYVNANGTIGNMLEATDFTPSSATLSTGKVTFSADVDENLDGIKFVMAEGADEEAAYGETDATGFTIKIEVPVANTSLLDGVVYDIKAASSETDDSVEISDDMSKITVVPGTNATLASAAGIQTVLRKAAFADESSLTDAQTAFKAAAGAVTVSGTGSGSAVGTYAPDEVTIQDYVPVAESKVEVTAAAGADPEIITYTFKKGLTYSEVADDYETAKAGKGDAAKFGATPVGTDNPAADATGATTDGYEGGTRKSPIKANAASAIDGSVYVTVKFANSFAQNEAYGDGDGFLGVSLDVFNQNGNIGTEEDPETRFITGKKTDPAVMANYASVTLDALDTIDNDMIYVPSDTSEDIDFAKPGTYTVYFQWHDASHKEDDNKWNEATNTLSVKNTLKAPTVNFSGRKVNGADVDSFKEIGTVNSDLNNKNSAAESLVAVLNKDFEDASENDKGQIVVKYAVIEENVFGADQDVKFYVNVGNTFSTN